MPRGASEQAGGAGGTHRFSLTYVRIEQPLLAGQLLLAVPQLYGVGYPVMYQAVGGHYVLWFLIVLAVGKMIATSLTIGIGGSGGVFAPSLFVGATAGMAFGEIARHLLGPAAGQPALYAVVAMGAVFTAAARAPLTSLASVVEMTGDFALTLPVMLAVAIATAISRALSYGTIYTTKLLRRGTDIDRATPWRALQDLKVADAMRAFPVPLTAAGHGNGTNGQHAPAATRLPGPVTYRRDPQVLFAGESLAQALRQLVIYGRDGLPVLSDDNQTVRGWVTNNRVLQAIAQRINTSQAQAAQGQLAAEWALADPEAALHQPPTPLRGYQVLEVAIADGSPATGQPLRTLTWPPGTISVSVLHHRRLRDPHPDLTLSPGDRIILLTRQAENQPAAPAPAAPPKTHG
jgi:chloride channel protein, CIC family